MVDSEREVQRSTIEVKVTKTDLATAPRRSPRKLRPPKEGDALCMVRQVRLGGVLDPWDSL